MAVSRILRSLSREAVVADRLATLNSQLASTWIGQIEFAAEAEFLELSRKLGKG